MTTSSSLVQSLRGIFLLSITNLAFIGYNLPFTIKKCMNLRNTILPKLYYSKYLSRQPAIPKQVDVFYKSYKLYKTYKSYKVYTPYNPQNYPSIHHSPTSLSSPKSSSSLIRASRSRILLLVAFALPSAKSFLTL